MHLHTVKGLATVLAAFHGSGERRGRALERVERRPAVSGRWRVLMRRLDGLMIASGV